MKVLGRGALLKGVTREDLLIDRVIFEKGITRDEGVNKPVI